MSARSLTYVVAVAAAAVVATGCPSRPDPSSTVGGPVAPLAAYPLKIKLAGMIAFAPETCSGQSCASVDALLPRADVPSQKNFPKVPSGPHPNRRFYRNYERYPLHHPVVRFKGKHIKSPADCMMIQTTGEAWVVLALFAKDPAKPDPPGPDTNFTPVAYDIALAAQGAGSGARLVEFDSIPVIYAGDKAPNRAPTPAKLSSTCPDDPACLAARMTFSAGEVLTAEHPLQAELADGTVGNVKFNYRSRGQNNSDCKDVGGGKNMYFCGNDTGDVKKPDGTTLTLAKIMEHVVASRTVTEGDVVLTLTKRQGATKVHACTLQAADSSGVEIEVLNIPAEELLDLPALGVEQRHVEHFGLSHLLADRKDWIYFYHPYPKKLRERNGRPFCTAARFEP